MQPLVTIGITSYKRIYELKRCIKSVDTKYFEEIEIIVSEDCSPLSAEIKTVVDNINNTSKYNTIFSKNEINLGYDGNLAAIIKKSQGKYIFFMSDDDTLHPGFLDLFIEFIRNNDNYGMYYAPFVYKKTGVKDRNHLKDCMITQGEVNAAKYVYDAILFSGLIFKREYVCMLDATRFINLNYFQVYLFLKTMLEHDCYYFAYPSVVCVGDGENAYGISESSGGNELLVNRKSIISNLEFNKGLIKVIRIFDEEFKTNILDEFAKQYSLHAYSGMSIARNEGIEYFNNYWKQLNSLDIKIFPIAKVYYVCLLILGSKISNKLLSGARKSLKNE